MAQFQAWLKAGKYAIIRLKHVYQHCENRIVSEAKNMVQFRLICFINRISIYSSARFLILMMMTFCCGVPRFEREEFFSAEQFFIFDSSRHLLSSQSFQLLCLSPLKINNEAITL